MLTANLTLDGWPVTSWPETDWPEFDYSSEWSNEPRSPYAEFDVGLPELPSEDQDQLDNDTAEYEHYVVHDCLADIYEAAAGSYDEGSGEGPQAAANSTWADMIGSFRLEWRRKNPPPAPFKDVFKPLEDLEYASRFHESVMHGDYCGNPLHLERFAWAYEQKQ